MSASKSNVRTVSQITRDIKFNLNRNFSSVWVAGEISGMTRAASGHVYLTLKDKSSQISGIIWESNLMRIRFEPKNGLEVICGGDIDVYAQRGTYQLIIRSLKPQGMGELELARKQLEAKLSAEGLFDPVHKKALPRFPNHVAVVTSPAGAAIRDFLQVISRRWPRLRLTVVPVKVQGPGSAHEIATGVHLCNQFQPRPDVIVVTRGGGSAEDLWSFNEEIVVRSIFNSEIPVISGVGHETDVLLSDLVADLRALTPSEAAEKLTPSFDEVVNWLGTMRQRLVTSLVRISDQARGTVEQLANRPVLTRPLDLIQSQAIELDNLLNQMKRSADFRISQNKQYLNEYSARLNSVNPLSVLSRGYSLTQLSDGKLVTSVRQLNSGDTLTTTTNDGFFQSVVGSIIDEKMTDESDPS
ncbi:MAG: exodeoxyribonuclease VII large subunit [Planctomycetota bacterium]